MIRSIFAVVILAVVGFVAADDFVLNSSEWRLAQAVEEKAGATPIEHCPIEDVAAACFEWHAALFTARSRIDRFMFEESPGRHFTEEAGPWQDVSDTEITKTYLHYSEPMVVYFNGRLLVFMKE